VAAAIAMVGLVVTVIINRNSDEHTQDVAVKHNKEEIAPATTKESEQTTTSADAPNQQATSTHSKKKNKSTTPAKELTEKKIQPKATVDPEPVVLVTEEHLVAEVQPEPAKKKKMVLVYSLQTIANS